MTIYNVAASGGDYTTYASAATDVLTNQWSTGNDDVISIEEGHVEDITGMGSLNPDMTGGGSITTQAANPDRPPLLYTATVGAGVTFGANTRNLYFTDICILGDQYQVMICTGSGFKFTNCDIQGERNVTTVLFNGGTHELWNTAIKGGANFGVVQVSGGSGVKFYNCPIEMQYAVSAASCALYLSVAGCVLKNCLPAINNLKGWGDSFVVIATAAAVANITLDYNHFRKSWKGNYIKWNVTSYATPAALNAAQPTQEANSPAATVFRNYEAGPRDIVENAGVDLSGEGGANDMFGAAWGSRWGIGPIKQTIPDTTPPVFSGGVSGVAATDLQTDKDIQVSCNAATDAAGSVRGYKYFIKAGDNSPFAAPDQTAEFTVNTAQKIRVANNVEVSVGIRAVDDSGNFTTNTDYVTVTPTVPDNTVQGPFESTLENNQFRSILTS